MKGTPVNPKTAKAILRITTMGLAMLAYGAIHKAEKAAQEKIDEHFADPESENNQDD